MRYLGTKAMNVTLYIEVLPKTRETKEFMDNPLLEQIDMREGYFSLILPENIRSIDDVKRIAFECVSGYVLTNEMLEYFKVELKDIEFKCEDAIYCLTLSEFTDFDINKMKQYIADQQKVENPNIPTKTEPIEPVVMDN